MGLQKNTHNQSDKQFLTVLADGKFHLKVEEGTEGATTREVEVDTIDDKGKKTGTEVKVVHEIVYDEIADEKITNMYFFKGKFSENLVLEIDNVGSVSLNLGQTYAEQILRKLPNIDLSLPVTLIPYNYKKNGKSNKGVTIMQGGVKLQDYYFDYDAKKSINGLPEPKVKADGSVNWTIYFETVKEFLMEQVQPIFEVNGFKAPEVKEDSATTSNETEVDEDDITKKF